MTSHTMLYLRMRHLETEVQLLRKAIFEWKTVAEMPKWVEKTMKDADVCANEIKKIDEGKVK